jgi:hypothetical protein
VHGERYNTGLRQREIDVETQVSSGIGERERDFEGNREDVTQENKFVEEAREGVGGGGGGGTGAGGREGNTIQTKQLITPGGGRGEWWEGEMVECVQKVKGDSSI